MLMHITTQLQKTQKHAKKADEIKLNLLKPNRYFSNASRAAYLA